MKQRYTTLNVKDFVLVLETRNIGWIYNIIENRSKNPDDWEYVVSYRDTLGGDFVKRKNIQAVEFNCINDIMCYDK